MRTACLLLLVSFFITVGNANAQRLVFAFGHAGYASPVGKLRDANRPGAGLEAGIGVGLGKTFLTGTVGTTWFASGKRESTSSRSGLRYTPVTLGLRKYVFTKILFLKADAGMATMKLIDTDIKNSEVTTSFGAGVKFTVLEAVVDYNTVYGGYGSWVGIKFGFSFGL